MERYDAIVVGGGVMGCASAYQLAKRGRRVLLLEQFALGHERGSSHGHSRIIRLAYDQPVYVRLAQAAFPLWRELEQESGAELMLATGGLDFAAPGVASFAATRATLLATAVAFEDLDHDQLAARFPQFRMPAGTVGLFQRDAAILNASASVAALAAEARRYGATLHASEPALELVPAGAGVIVRTPVAAYHADRLIVTAGSWARPLLHQLDLDLPLAVTKEHVAFFRPRDPAQFIPGRFPIFIHHHDGGAPAYGFPIFGLPGIKVAFHLGGAATAPEDPDRAVEPAQLDALREFVDSWLPQAAGEIIFAQTCRYTTTPDEHFIIDRHPSYPQIVIGSPCSGHGFKFGILLGSILADLAEYGATAQPVEMFALDRFTRPAKL